MVSSVRNAQSGAAAANCSQHSHFSENFYPGTLQSVSARRGSAPRWHEDSGQSQSCARCPRLVTCVEFARGGLFPELGQASLWHSQGWPGHRDDGQVRGRNEASRWGECDRSLGGLQRTRLLARREICPQLFKRVNQRHEQHQHVKQFIPRCSP